LSIGASCQKQNALGISLPMQYEWHKFNINYGPPSIRDHEFSDQNLTFGIGLSYDHQYSKRVYGHVGVTYIPYKSKINRTYNRKYWNDFTALIYYTNNTKYSLLSFPVGLDVLINHQRDNQLLIGNSVNVNVVLKKEYGYGSTSDALNTSYLFGFSDQLNLKYRRTLKDKFFIEANPFIRVIEKWRKDEVLFENQNEYHNLLFNAVGINFTAGITF
jgi:hypothetical protein